MGYNKIQYDSTRTRRAYAHTERDKQSARERERERERRYSETERARERETEYFTEVVREMMGVRRVLGTRWMANQGSAIVPTPRTTRRGVAATPRTWRSRPCPTDPCGRTAPAPARAADVIAATSRQCPSRALHLIRVARARSKNMTLPLPSLGPPPTTKKQKTNALPRCAYTHT